MSFYEGANGYFTILDVIKSKDCRDFVSGTAIKATEIADAYTESMNEYEEKVLVKTSDGVVNFRDFNEYSLTQLPSYTTRTTTCANLNPIIEIDAALFDRWQSDGTLGQSIDDVKKDTFETAIKALGKQFYYGTGVDAKGFPGIDSYVQPGLRFSAGGSTSNAQSALYFVSWGRRDVSMVYGGGVGVPFDWSPWRRETRITVNSDSGVDREYRKTVMVCDFLMYPAVRVKKPASVAAVKNIESGLTDAKLYKAFAYMQAAGMDGSNIVAYAHPLVIAQLQASRTATNAAGAPAPMPTDICDGIPLRSTLSLNFGTDAVDSTAGIITL